MKEILDVVDRHPITTAMLVVACYVVALVSAGWPS